VDELPETPGFRELWGRGVYHCPYCHGWEVRDRPLAVYSGDWDPAGAVGWAVLIRNRSRDLVLLTDGPSDLDAAGREKLGALGVPLNEKRIARLEGKSDGSEGLSRVVFADGSSLEREGLFHVPPQRQRSGLAETLGCEVVAIGSAAAVVKADPMTGETSLPGVCVAANARRPASPARSCGPAQPGVRDGGMPPRALEEERPLLFASLRGLPGGRTGIAVDVVGAILLGLGSFLVLALQQGQSWGWSFGLFLAALATGLLLLVAFVMVELHRRSPLVNLALFRRRRYVAGCFATFANTVGLIGLLYFFNLYAQSSVLFDLSPLHASLVLLPYTVSMFLFAYPSGRIADRIGYRVPVVVGLLVMTAGFVMLSRVSVGTQEAGLLLPIVLCGLGVGLTYSTTSAAGMAAVPAEEAGQGAGVINMARFLGAVFVIAAGTILYVGQGVATLDEHLDRVGQVEKTKLDRVLTGSPSAPKSTAKQLDPDTKDAFVSGARQGIVGGF